MEERARDNPAEGLVPESLHNEGFELVTLVSYADIRGVKSVLYVLSQRHGTRRHTHSERVPI